ncbi:sulfotransferase family protein [Desulfotignum phosphitoxidans]|uniref:Glycosyl transferase, family 2 n=1 Tax=Desulfotignum phosphitoxidans DSM 13687 TaxID=1286635 RepID=S0G1Q7_9BACT|nr:hypothetical protein [Desulfotignum phosphitoxidans]EMS80860.1 glycosyl transferase, family 2 [Desulfotignum phosphitoxidans DSM 13687]
MMNNQRELVFAEYNIDHFVDAFFRINEIETKRILIKPTNSFAVEFKQRVLNKNPQVSFIDEDGINETTQFEDNKAQKNISVLCIPDAKELSKELLKHIDDNAGTILAPITPNYFKKKPLFLISIPKSGTHLLYHLVDLFGYKRGVTYSSIPHPGNWYCLEYSNSHTSAQDFFIDTVRRSPFGNRDHAFPHTPAIFLYRNPLDILVSEANYYHLDGKALFHGYFNGLTFEERVMKLIDDPWLLGSIRKRTGKFIPWLKFPNVIPISFEELIGEKGGGSLMVQTRLIWSLQLKLHIPGSPLEFGSKAFQSDSPTFRKGLIGSHKKKLNKNSLDAFYKLPQDFMDEYGYNGQTAIPAHSENFLKRPVEYSAVNYDDTPIDIEHNYLDHFIVKYQNKYYGVPYKIGYIDFEDKNWLLHFLHSSENLIAVKQQIARKPRPSILLLIGKFFKKHIVGLTKVS